MWKAVVMGAWGAGVGTFMGTFSLNMVHYMGIDKYTPMMGATMLFIAAGYSTIGPFSGELCIFDQLRFAGTLYGYLP